LDPHELHRREQTGCPDRRPLPALPQALRSGEGPRSPQECARRSAGRSQEDRRLGEREDKKLLEEHANYVREMEKELKDSKGDIGHDVPKIEPGVRKDNDNMPKLTKLNMDMLV